MNDMVDPQLRALHHALLSIYNKETERIRANPTTIASINATNFLAGQAVGFADAAIFLMEDNRQPLDVPVALLRTCLEAQARANHITAAIGTEREDRAGELVRLMEIGRAYYEKLVIQSYKDTDESQYLARDKAYLPAMKKLLGAVDTSDHKTLKKELDQLAQRWTYGKVIERSKFGEPAVLNRSEAQRIQPALYLCYLQCCSFVHADPVSLRHKQFLTKTGVTYNLVLAEIVAGLCFFIALGKESDQDLVNIKKAIIAFDVNDRILPKDKLPAF
jgi:hypothetical protein